MKCERSFIGVVVLRNFGGVSITDAYIPESTPLDSIIATARQSIDVLKALHSRNLHHGAIAPENVRVYLYNDSIENVRLRNFFDWQGASERRDQFAPPELHQSRFMLGVEKIDVWALGVCIALALHRFNVLEVPQFVREFNPMMFTLEMREAVVESTDRLINELFALETQMDRVPLLAPWLRSMLAYNPNERSLPA
jgi:serine/threonine protein kinase